MATILLELGQLLHESHVCPDRLFFLFFFLFALIFLLFILKFIFFYYYAGKIENSYYNSL